MEETHIDVSQDPSPANSEVAQTQVQEVVVPEVITTPDPQPKGSQTPSENLYAALAEERKLRKEAEEELSKVTSTPSTDDVFSDEGKALKSEVDTLQQRLDRIEDENRLKDLRVTYPALKDKSSEFEEYRKDFPRHKLENVAKLFLTEKGLLEVTPERKGLEPTSGGGHRDPAPSGMTAEDVKQLRENDYKKYLKLLSEGKINIK